MKHPAARRSINRWVVAAAVLLIAWGLQVAFTADNRTEATAGGEGSSDLRMYASITDQVAHGAGYYATVAKELPDRGYATKPMLNWRLPTLAWLNALMPAGARRAVVVTLGFGVIVLWLAVVRDRAPRVAAIGMPLLFTIVPDFLRPDAAYMHELWAGLLIAGSLGLRAADFTIASVIAGAAALFVRELALPYVILMLAFAIWERRRREATLWLLAIAMFAAFFAWHARQVLPLIPEGGLERNWLQFGGWRFALATTHVNVLLLLAPAWLTAIVVPVLWAGLWHWPDALGRRVAATVTCYFAAFLLVGLPDNWYWGLLTAPLLPLGFFGWFAERRHFTRRNGERHGDTDIRPREA